jgi:hypothetical protein
MTGTTCTLCRRPAGGHGTFRASGLDLCPQCFAGQSVDALRERRGFTISERTWLEGVKAPSTWSEVSGAIAHPVDVEAVFSNEGFLEKIGKLFTGELQTGDPLFDDKILVRTSTPEQLAALLRDEGLRMAILDLVPVVLRVDLDAKGVRTSYCHAWQDAPGRDEIVRGVAVLLHHLEAAAVGAGIGPYR